jgi:hypothetical protein
MVRWDAAGRMRDDWRNKKKEEKQGTRRGCHGKPAYTMGSSTP